ncbi:hypothetical protein J6590_078457 [Homalodisca vitripennis]|nr:hypothetical protein J6590_078457 [Homalodisca vitripennis]
MDASANKRALNFLRVGECRWPRGLRRQLGKSQVKILVCDYSICYQYHRPCTVPTHPLPLHDEVLAQASAPITSSNIPKSCLEPSPGIVTKQDAGPEHNFRVRESESHATPAQAKTARKSMSALSSAPSRINLNNEAGRQWSGRERGKVKPLQKLLKIAGLKFIT